MRGLSSTSNTESFTPMAAILIHLALVADREDHDLVLSKAKAVLDEIPGPASKDHELAAAHVDRAADERVGCEDLESLQDDGNRFRRRGGIRLAQEARKPLEIEKGGWRESQRRQASGLLGP